MPPRSPIPARFNPVWPADWSAFSLAAFATAMVHVMWPYNGWTNVAPLAGEIRDPQRNVPRAFIGGMLVLIAVYTGVDAYFLAVPASDMTELGGAVSTEVCYRLLGPVGLMLASAALMVSVLGTVGGNLLVGPRSVFALSGRGWPRGFSGIATPGTKRRWSRDGVDDRRLRLVRRRRSRSTSGHRYRTEVVLRRADRFYRVRFDALGNAGRRYDLRLPGAIPRQAGRSAAPGYPVVPAIYIVTMLAVLANMLTTTSQRFEAIAGLDPLLREWSCISRHCGGDDATSSSASSIPQRKP